MPRRRWTAAVLMLIALAACGPAPAGLSSAASSPLAPGPAAVTLLPTGAPSGSPTPGPLTEATRPIVIEPSAPPPTPTQRIPPVNLPPETLTIFSPGPGSQVTSPIRVSGFGGPSNNERLRLRLYGEDNRLLIDHTTGLFAYPGNAGRFASVLSFQIPGVAEAGRLEIASFDSRYNRVAHINTEPLILLSTGQPLIHPQNQPPEELDILAPRDGQSVAGGTVQVRAAGWVEADVPITVDLVDRQGAVIATAQAKFDSPEVGQVGVFTVSLAYATPISQYARVVLTERDPSGAYIVHLSSVEVYLRR
jgi:hypothetical protein